jgi:hypothetical protein
MRRYFRQFVPGLSPVAGLSDTRVSGFIILAGLGHESFRLYNTGGTEVSSAGGDGGREPVWGRIANAKIFGWVLYAAGFAVWLFGTQATPHSLIGTRPRRVGFLASYPTSKQNSELQAGSNAQCEQCNHTHADNQHRECYRIVVQPMQPLLHGAPLCSASSSKREGRRDNFSGHLEFRCSKGPTEGTLWFPARDTSFV